MDTFTFCPGRNVPQTMPPDAVMGMSMNGWNFSSKPNVPYQKRFKVKLHGLRWYLDPATELYDETTNVDFNARVLEKFYERNQAWNPFLFTHQHLGQLTVRFLAALSIPPAPENSGGWLDPVEIMLIHHNPGY